MYNGMGSLKNADAIGIYWLIGMEHVSEAVSDAITCNTAWEQRLHLDSLLFVEHPSYKIAVQEFLTRPKSAIRFAFGCMPIGVETRINMERESYLIGVVRDPYERLCQMYIDSEKNVSFARFVHLMDESGRYPRNGQILHLTGTQDTSIASDIVVDKYKALVSYPRVGMLIKALFPKASHTTIDRANAAKAPPDYKINDDDRILANSYHSLDSALFKEIQLNPLFRQAKSNL